MLLLGEFVASKNRGTYFLLIYKSFLEKRQESYENKISQCYKTDILATPA